MRRRQGVAIFVVMTVVLLLGAFAAMVWTSGSDSQAPLEQSFEKRQAEYLAKGAQQHALLKARLLPTELYDAISYSIGRNPFFDFGLGLSTDLVDGGTKLAAEDADRNPGPMFYTGNPTVTLIDDPDPENDGKILKISRTNIEGDASWNKDALREMFTYDVATQFPKAADLNKCIVVVSSKVHDDVAMGPGWQDPFIGNYKVQALRILGLQGGRRYDKDTMLLTTIGSVKRAGQISLVTNLGGKPKGLSPIRRTSHQANPDAFGEYDTVFEDMNSYNERVGDKDTGTDTNDVFDPEGAESSGRRTEIATGVYYITRKAVDTN